MSMNDKARCAQENAMAVEISRHVPANGMLIHEVSIIAPPVEAIAQTEH
jgi:hypothetical protein